MRQNEPRLAHGYYVSLDWSVRRDQICAQNPLEWSQIVILCVLQVDSQMKKRLHQRYSQRGMHWN